MKCLCIYHIMSYICFNLYSCGKTSWQSLFVQTTTSNVNLSHKHNQLKIQSKKIYPVYNVQVNKWGFLKKNCDAALVRGVLQDNLVLSTGLIINNYWMRLSMISWIIKTSCLCYLPQPSASADNTDAICSRYCIYHVKITSYLWIDWVLSTDQIFHISLMYNNNL